MKKLMFLAGVAAAMVASANVCADAKDECDSCADPVEAAGTAHKVAISLKTTGVATQKIKATDCTAGGCVYYRVQKTVKVSGYIWGALEDCTSCKLLGDKVALWTNSDAFGEDDDLGLAVVIGRIGKGVKSNKIEAYGSLSASDFGSLTWAGFGSLTFKTIQKKTDCDEEVCAGWVKSISGGIAGFLVAPEAPEAKKCAEACDPIEYEGCCEDLQMFDEDGVTAAYGTIKITYDAATAKKVAKANAESEGDDDEIAEVIAAKVPKAVDEIYVGEAMIEE